MTHVSSSCWQTNFPSFVALSGICTRHSFRRPTCAYAYFKFSPTFEKAAMVKVAKQFMEPAWSQRNISCKLQSRWPPSRTRSAGGSFPFGEFFLDTEYIYMTLGKTKLFASSDYSWTTSDSNSRHPDNTTGIQLASLRTRLSRTSSMLGAFRTPAPCRSSSESFSQFILCTVNCATMAFLTWSRVVALTFTSRGLKTPT